MNLIKTTAIALILTLGLFQAEAATQDDSDPTAQLRQCRNSLTECFSSTQRIAQKHGTSSHILYQLNAILGLEISPPDQSILRELIAGMSGEAAADAVIKHHTGRSFEDLAAPAPSSTTSTAPSSADASAPKKRVVKLTSSVDSRSAAGQSTRPVAPSLPDMAPTSTVSRSKVSVSASASASAADDVVSRPSKASRVKAPAAESLEDQVSQAKTAQRDAETQLLAAMMTIDDITTTLQSDGLDNDRMIAKLRLLVKLPARPVATASTASAPAPKAAPAKPVATAPKAAPAKLAVVAPAAIAHSPDVSDDDAAESSADESSDDDLRN